MKTTGEFINVGRKPKYDWESLKNVGDTIEYPEMTPKQSNSMRVSGRGHGVRLSCRGLRTGGYRVTVSSIIEGQKQKF